MGSDQNGLAQQADAGDGQTVLTSQLHQFRPSLLSMRFVRRRIDTGLVVIRGDRIEIAISFSRSTSFASSRISKYVRVTCSCVNMFAMLGRHFHVERCDASLQTISIPNAVGTLFSDRKSRRRPSQSQDKCFDAKIVYDLITFKQFSFVSELELNMKVGYFKRSFCFSKAFGTIDLFGI